MNSPTDPFVAIGALLLRSGDLDAAVHAITMFVLHPNERNRDALTAAGLNVDHVRDFVALLPRDPVEVTRVCELARAWALGRRSSAKAPTWEPVVTTGEVTAEGVDRMTAETMTGLIVGARSTIRIFSPFVDPRGIHVLAVSLAAATRRGVRVWIGHTQRGNRQRAVEELEEGLRRDGDWARVKTTCIENTRPFPHLKLIAVDGVRAYIGSANLTWPALTSNAEVGALVDGEPVRVLERWYDALLANPNREGMPPAIPMAAVRAKA